MTVDKKKSFQQAQIKASSANKAASFRQAAGKGVVATELEKRGINLALFGAQNDKQVA